MNEDITPPLVASVLQFQITYVVYQELMLYWTIPNTWNDQSTRLLLLENNDVSQHCLDFGSPLRQHKPHRDCDHLLSFYASLATNLLIFMGSLYSLLPETHIPRRGSNGVIISSLHQCWFFSRKFILNLGISTAANLGERVSTCGAVCVSWIGVKGGKLKVSFNPR